MAKKNSEELARILYIQGYSQKDIAERLEVSEVSVSNWKKKGCWDNLKTNLLNSRHERLGELYNELAEFNRMVKDKEGYKICDSKEADARRKLIADISELERKYSIGETVCIAKDFITFAQSVDAPFAKQALPMFDSFINHVISKAKWREE
jgi:transposase